MALVVTYIMSGNIIQLPHEKDGDFKIQFNSNQSEKKFQVVLVAKGGPKDSTLVNLLLFYGCTASDPM